MEKLLVFDFAILLICPFISAQEPPTGDGGEMIVDSEESKLGVVCHQDYIEVTVERKNYPGLDTNVTHLEDDRCFPGYRDDSKVVFTIGFDDCKTEHEDDGESLIYKNRIIAIVRDVDDEESITRTNTRILPFQCSYKKKAVISKKMYSPRLTYVITKTADYGNFTYHLDMYKDSEYNKTLDNYPALVGIGQRLYFEARVQSGDTELVLFPDECKATVSAEYDSTPDHDIIEKACPVDKSLEYEYKMSAIQRFSLTAFRFKSGYDDVYIHCKLTVCRIKDEESKCVKGCQKEENTSRKRRDATDDLSVNLYIGPVRLEEKQKQVMDSPAAVSKTDNSMFVVVGALVGSLGVIAVGLIAALVIVTKRKRPIENAPSLLIREE